MMKKLLKLNKSLIVKISALAALCVILLNASLLYVSYSQQKGQYFGELRTQLNMVHKPLEEKTDELETGKALLTKNKDADRTQSELAYFQQMMDEYSGSERITNTYLLYPEMKEENGTSILTVMLANQAMYEAGVGPLFLYELTDDFKAAADEALTKGIGITDVYSDEYGTWVSILKAINDESGKTVALMGIDFDYTTIKSDLNAKLNKTLLIGLIAGGIAVAAICFTVSWALKPVIDLILITRSTAEGDLSKTVKVKRNDEIGQLGASFNQMVHSLSSVLLEVSKSSNQLTTSSHHLSASAEQTAKAAEHITEASQQMADGASQQVRAAENGVDNMRKVLARIYQITTSAETVADTTSRASEKSLAGGQAVESAKIQMNKISDTVNGLAQDVTRLADTSQEIGKITDVITQIAQKTRMLSLNASIEAARVGEQGRGFSVVANEVKHLAEQSSDSAKNIAELIQTVIIEIGKVREMMQTTTMEVTMGIEAVHTTGALFSEIQHFVDEAVRQVQEVSTDAQLISDETAEVASLINEVVKVAHTTAAGTQNVSAATEEQLATMEEISSSTLELTRMSDQLRVLVDRFKL